MDSNRHEHTTEVELPNSRPVSGLWIVGVISAVLLLGGLLYMGFTITLKQQELTGFQTFVTTVLGALFAGVTGLFVKVSYDKNKTQTQQQEFQKWQITKTMEHEETLEKIRLQTNGRLHSRDELAEVQTELIGILLAEVERNGGITPETSGVIAALRTKIKEGEKVIKTLKPFYNKDGN